MPLLLLFTSLIAGLLAVSAQEAARPEVAEHVAAARRAAGSDFTEVYQALCQTGLALAAGGPGRGGGAASPPPRATWYAPPQRVFDNLYFVGMKEFSAWAITTSDGIILIDALWDYSVEAEVDQGLRAVGLQPGDIRYVLITHGHPDHAGGAKYLQEKFRARLLMSAADYDLLERTSPAWKPTQDLVATDGQSLTLGDTTIRLYITPGHTDGTISLIFPVRDGADRHTAVLWGGTFFDVRPGFGVDAESLSKYAASAKRFREMAAASNGDVMLSNHSSYDGAAPKLQRLKERLVGEQHPFVVGRNGVERYLTTVGECAEAASAVSRPKTQGGAR